MPLLYVDIIEGRTPAEVQELLDAIHEAVVEAFEVPQRDRYQVVHIPSSPRGRHLGHRSRHQPLGSAGGFARGEQATSARIQRTVLQAAGIASR